MELNELDLKHTDGLVDLRVNRGLPRRGECDIRALAERVVQRQRKAVRARIREPHHSRGEAGALDILQGEVPHRRSVVVNAVRKLARVGMGRGPRLAGSFAAHLAQLGEEFRALTFVDAHVMQLHANLALDAIPTAEQYHTTEMLGQTAADNVGVPCQEAGQTHMHIALQHAPRTAMPAAGERVGPVSGLRHDSEGTSAPAQRAKEVRMLPASAGRDYTAVREHDLCLEEVRRARTVHAAVDAVTAAKREADMTDCRASAPDDEPVALHCFAVDLSELHAAAKCHGRPSFALHTACGPEVVMPRDVVQLVCPEQQAARLRRTAEKVVAGALD
mmetsp:Transcript_70049/g.177808  ORF Transcript_70049/g.177808 Transcript_70049/m.177808 type:complete len:332 (-) Transcript_70049:367-1362(-)